MKAAEPPPDATSGGAGLLSAHGFKHIGDLMFARDRGDAAGRLLRIVRSSWWS